MINYITETDDKLMAILAVYDKDALKAVKIEHITPIPNQEGSITLEGMMAYNGYEVKCMLWHQDKYSPVVDMARSVVGK